MIIVFLISFKIIIIYFEIRIGKGIVRWSVLVNGSYC